MTKVGIPGADMGIRHEDVTLASLLKDEGYVTAQYGKNHLGDQDEFLPTEHGFDEFFGNLYHLNAEEEPEHPDYPQDSAFRERPSALRAVWNSPLASCIALNAALLCPIVVHWNLFFSCVRPALIINIRN